MWPDWNVEAARRDRRRPEAVPVIAAASLCLITVLSGCAKSPAAGSGPAATASSGSAADPVSAATATRSPAASASFTIRGDRPVLANGSQDTHAQTPTAHCSSATLTADKALGARIAAGFALGGFPVAADLLNHFLAGSGTAVRYPAGSAISRQARASSAFQAVNDEVQQAVRSQLKAGRTRLRLSAAQLPEVAFESGSSDLYWGFRGTQGLSVTGSGRREHDQYAGTLTYAIRDSYGFPASDTLNGFGAPMRYLQTVCGAPEHARGAHWFPDVITVTVPFTMPA